MATFIAWAHVVPDDDTCGYPESFAIYGKPVLIAKVFIYLFKLSVDKMNNQLINMINFFHYCTRGLQYRRKVEPYNELI